MTGDDHIWLTYEEAAERFGIKPASVKRRAAMRKWPKRRGNGRHVKVGVPSELLADDITPVITSAPIGDITDDTITDKARIAALEVEIRMVREQMSDLRQDREKQIDEMRSERKRLFYMIEDLSRPRWPWSRRIHRP